MAEDIASTGFVLESADSVRFGPEYNEEERERNRQMLFGEILCGLLMGDQVWTNTIFAFDSQGMVEVLGALARAFVRTPGKEQFLPFIISAYPGDKDPWSGQHQDPKTWAHRPWANPAELFLRCYAHRLRNWDGFQLSATPDLEKKDERARRAALAEDLKRMAETGHRPDGLKITRAEEGHFENIFSIDRFLRSWLGDAGPAAFDRYCTHAPLLESPIRTIRGHWTGRYTDGDEIRKMRRFLEKAASLTDFCHPSDGVLANAGEILGDLLKLPSDHLCFANRTHFRTHLKNLGIPEMSDTFRVLIELVDGHYIRTQYTELSHSAREITSPASQSKASQLGETWATRTMQACLRSSASIRPWQFINRIQAAPLKGAVKLDLDRIALRFADFVSDTDRRHELDEYRHLLALARKAQGMDGGTDEDARKKFDALLTNVSTCIDKINTHMAGTGTEFHFNVNDEATCAGSLSLTFAGNESVSQCTGPRDSPNPARLQPLGPDASEGSNNCFPDAEA